MARKTTSRPAVSAAQQNQRFELHRAATAAKVARSIVARQLSFSDIVTAPEYEPFRALVLREESAVLRGDDIRDQAKAYELFEKISAALPAASRAAFAALDDWRMFESMANQEAAFAIGFALGRGGAL